MYIYKNHIITSLESLHVTRTIAWFLFGDPLLVGIEESESIWPSNESIGSLKEKLLFRHNFCMIFVAPKSNHEEVNIQDAESTDSESNEFVVVN